MDRVGRWTRPKVRRSALERSCWLVEAAVGISGVSVLFEDLGHGACTGLENFDALGVVQAAHPVVPAAPVGLVALLLFFQLGDQLPAGRGDGDPSEPARAFRDVPLLKG